MSCPYCGGEVRGDGYTFPLVCENTSAPDGAEPDSGPWFCYEGGASTGAERSGAAQRGPQAAPRTAGGFPALGGGGRGVGAEERPGQVLHPVTLQWHSRDDWERECRDERLGAARAVTAKDAANEIVLEKPSSPRFSRELMDRLAPRYRPTEHQRELFV